MTERILCVLRNDTHDRQLVDTLRAASSYEVTPVFSFEDAVQELASGDYTILITEYDLPDMTAIDVLAAVNSMRPDIATIVVDDSLDPTHAIRAFRLGAMDYVFRPVNLDFLLIRIGQELALRHARSEKRKPSPAEPLLRVPKREARLDREQRPAALLLNRNQFVKINKILTDLRQETAATFAGLMDAEHNIMSAVGEMGNSDLMTLKRVFAKDYGVRKLSSVLDEQNFSHTFLSGDNNSVFITDFGGAQMVSMVVVTPANAKPGMVWLSSKQAAGEIETVIREAQKPRSIRQMDFSDSQDKE